MKIAIIAPSQVPYVQGGAERLWRGLRDAVEQEGHICELFNVPSPDNNFWSIIGSYAQFFSMNFDTFDVIVTGKNPAWMVQHPRHYVYMLHPLRGVYDTYHLFGLSEDVASDNLLVNEIAAMCDDGIGTADLLSMLAELREQLPEDDAATALPSPLLRKVIHRLDANALGNVRRVSAISKTVADRSSYFHGARGVAAYYPVSKLRGKANKLGAHYLTYSRLDAPKRLDMVLEAYRATQLDRPLIIVGEGPEETKLRDLAENDPRVQFTGRISDERLKKLISDAHAIVFAPLMEDYGYVTAEALSSGRPVITTVDSGGPTELVIDGRNGWVVEPEVEALREAFERADMREDWENLRDLCLESVRDISWKPLIKEITSLGTATRIAADVRRRRALSLSTYPILPPQGGGQARVHFLNKALSKDFDVDVVCLVDGARQTRVQGLSDSLTVHEVPSSAEFSEFDWNYYQQSGVPTTDIAFATAYHLNTSYVELCRKLTNECDVLIAEQCYTYPLLRELSTTVPRVYNSQNIELDLKDQMFAPSAVRDQLMDWTRSAERLALTDASLVVHCSEQDRVRSEGLYGVEDRPVQAVIENGTDASNIEYRPLAERRAIRANLRLDDGYCLFLASWHEPNIEACRALFRIAKLSPETTFCVAGTVGEFFKQRSEVWPKNVIITGTVSETERAVLMQGASCALNPMSSGSGTNIKMFDYLAAGLPVLSTPVGARGLDEIMDYIVVEDLENFQCRIPEVMEKAPNINARRAVMAQFDWSVLGKDYSRLLQRITG